MFGLLNASMINLHAHNKNIIAAFFIGCFFMLACENDVNEVKELGKKKPGVEEGKAYTRDALSRTHLEIKEEDPAVERLRRNR